MKKLIPALTALLLSGAAYAQMDWSSGEIKKIDLAQSKVTLQHGEIVNLDMPPMKMVFFVVDPVMLEGLEVDDRVRFIADKENGRYVVVKMEKK